MYLTNVKQIWFTEDRVWLEVTKKCTIWTVFSETWNIFKEIKRLNSGLLNIIMYKFSIRGKRLRRRQHIGIYLLLRKISSISKRNKWIVVSNSNDSQCQTAMNRSVKQQWIFFNLRTKHFLRNFMTTGYGHPPLQRLASTGKH